MTIFQIAVLGLLALAAGRLRRGRALTMLAISAAAIFWLQPPEPFLGLRFWLPVAMLALTVLSWALTSSTEMRSWRQNWKAACVLTAVILAAALSRYLPESSLRIVGAPPLLPVIVALLGFSAAALLLLRWNAAASFWRYILILGIIGAFIVLKSPQWSNWASLRLAEFRGTSLAPDAAPIAWLGYSYLAFRLLHTIRDRQSGRLPAVNLAEYSSYTVFFPAFTSGPIDRLERFVPELREPLPLCDEDWIFAGRRLLMGLFKKFVVADLLAVISINDVLVYRVQAGGWLWLLLYAYAFRIYFDFSGYTDLAIGMGRLMGIRLPENFASPYLKPNLTQFWNSWHITLTQWFRGYVFNPVVRTLRTLKWPLPAWVIILTAQFTTMVLIGLWHGMSWGFAAWGAWHAAGLFLHNRWAEWIKSRGLPEWIQRGAWHDVLQGAGVFLTFNYVALGWLFFTLSTPAVAWLAIQRMFGLG